MTLKSGYFPYPCSRSVPISVVSPHIPPLIQAQHLHIEKHAEWTIKQMSSVSKTQGIARFSQFTQSILCNRSAVFAAYTVAQKRNLENPLLRKGIWRIRFLWQCPTSSVPSFSQLFFTTGRNRKELQQVHIFGPKQENNIFRNQINPVSPGCTPSPHCTQQLTISSWVLEGYAIVKVSHKTTSCHVLTGEFGSSKLSGESEGTNFGEVISIYVYLEPRMATCSGK